MKNITYLELKVELRNFVKNLMSYDNVNVDYNEQTLTLRIDLLTIPNDFFKENEDE